MKDRTLPWLGVALIVLGLAGLVMPSWLLNLLTISFAKALVVIGLVIMMRSGLVDFGLGLYFALGGYIVGIVGAFLGWSDIFLLLAASAVGGALVSGVLGLLMSRYRAIFFAMLSLGFSMILYGLLVKSPALGSTDGFNVIDPTFLGFAPGTQGQRYGLFLVTGLVAFGSAYLIQRYLRSGQGAVGSAIRENEVRLEYLGASVRRTLYRQYLYSGVLASLGGALYAFTAGHVDPTMAYWTTSGEFVFIALLGGTLHAAAPLLGAPIFEFLRSYALQFAPHSWQIILGVILLLIIVFLPKGLWSLLRRWGPAR